MVTVAIIKIERLESRRTKLYINFAKKCLTSRHRDLFLPNSSTKNTRNRKLFADHKVNSEWVFMSPLVYLTRLLSKSFVCCELWTMGAGLYSLFDCIIAFNYTILQLTSSFEINLNK